MTLIKAVGNVQARLPMFSKWPKKGVFLFKIGKNPHPEWGEFFSPGRDHPRAPKKIPDDRKRLSAPGGGRRGPLLQTVSSQSPPNHFRSVLENPRFFWTVCPIGTRIGALERSKIYAFSRVGETIFTPSGVPFPEIEFFGKPGFFFLSGIVPAPCPTKSGHPFFQPAKRLLRPPVYYTKDSDEKWKSLLWEVGTLKIFEKIFKFSKKVSATTRFFSVPEHVHSCGIGPKKWNFFRNFEWEKYFENFRDFREIYKSGWE